MLNRHEHRSLILIAQVGVKQLSLGLIKVRMYSYILGVLKYKTCYKKSHIAMARNTFAFKSCC